MFFDTSKSCDVCTIRRFCLKNRQIRELEDIISKTEVRSCSGHDSWPLTSYLNEFKDILPVKYVCEHVGRAE